MRVATIIAAAALALATAAQAEPKDRNVKASTIAAAITATWQCQDHLGVERTRVGRSPWSLPKGEYRAWVLNKWTLTRSACRAALKEKKRQWNWQAFPSWVIKLAVCETGGSGGARPGEPNWFAEGSSSHGTFYSAFNISRREYDTNARLMGVRGWNEGAGVPSPYEQAMALIGHVRRFGNNGFGSCSGIARASWDG